jgi:asparagine synthetase B (glutamine-hydrolysing)
MKKNPRVIEQTVAEVFLNLTEVFLTLAEVFPCFFLSRKANARVKLTKTGHGPHSMLFGCYVCCSM